MHVHIRFSYIFFQSSHYLRMHVWLPFHKDACLFQFYLRMHFLVPFANTLLFNICGSWFLWDGLICKRLSWWESSRGLCSGLSYMILCCPDYIHLGNTDCLVYRAFWSTSIEKFPSWYHIINICNMPFPVRVVRDYLFLAVHFM